MITNNPEIIQKTVANLQKNHFTASYYPSKEEAVAHLLTLIADEATIGVGGSWTIEQLNILDKLEAQGHTILNHNKPGLNPDQIVAIRRQQLNCDVFMTSSNAITEAGQLVNTDGVGNRVAAMIFGPKRVIVVAGINKIVKDLDQADARIKTTAAPLNNKRLNKPHPCVKTGECMNCQLPTRICNVTTVLNKRPALSDIHIILIGEELGF
jgi:hypothetical protein